MNIQILYTTLTGHSKKIAMQIAKQTGAKLYDVKQNPQIQNCDLLLIVSGIYGGESNAKLLDYVKNLSPNQVKKVALLTSSTKAISQGTLRKIISDNGIHLITEEFLCKGSFLFMSIGHPNKMEVENAILFSKKQIEQLEEI